jgi:RND family efflux transporter MFP subunit
MKIASIIKATFLIVALTGVALLGWKIYDTIESRSSTGGAARAAKIAAPVLVHTIEQGPITHRRTFTGSLEASASFVVAARVAGSLKQMEVNLSDRVEKGSTVASLEDDEYQQAVAHAAAALDVARANATEADSALQIANRSLARSKELETRGIEPESELDLVIAEHLSKQAEVAVSLARVKQAEAELAAAKVRLSYADVVADWPGDDQFRVVGERYVDEGASLTANTPLLRILRLDPMIAVIFAPERDYASLATGLAVTLATDSYPNQQFAGTIQRISSVFRQNTRQARVEISLENPKLLLKPGMFARISIELTHLKSATIVPITAVTKRNDRTGVFLVDEKASVTIWKEVEVGIRDGDRVQISGSEPLTGRVVTLGQQLIDDGSPITIPGESDPDSDLPAESTL